MTGIEYTLIKKELAYQVREIYDKIQPVQWKSQDGSKWNDKFIVMNKKNMCDGYMWEKEIPIDKYDKMDQEFVQSTKSFQTELFFGLHTYGGYYGFFRPDLEEVINLIYPWYESLVVKPNRIYVTTEPSPSGGIGDCYDPKTDRHKACTTIWWK